MNYNSSKCGANGETVDPLTDLLAFFFVVVDMFLYELSDACRMLCRQCMLLSWTLRPLFHISFCLVCLMQSLYRTNQKPIDSAHRITPTLISLIVLFTLFVTPSYLLDFIVRMTGGSVNYRAFKTATTITNFLLLVNFSVNFVLYLVINVEFRRATRDLVTCRDTECNDTAVSTTHQTSVTCTGNSYRLVSQGIAGSSHNDGGSGGSSKRHIVSETVLSD